MENVHTVSFQEDLPGVSHVPAGGGTGGGGTDPTGPRKNACPIGELHLEIFFVWLPQNMLIVQRVAEASAHALLQRPP